MDWLTSLLSSDKIAIVVPAIIAFNVILGGVGQLLGAFHQQNAESTLGKICGYITKVTDFLSGNIKH